MSRSTPARAQARFRLPTGAAAFCLLLIAPLAAQQFLDPRLQPQVPCLPPHDVDGDGLADLLSLDGNTVRIHRNLGFLRFAPAAPLATLPGVPGLVRPLDFDGDGDVDLVHYGGGTIGNTFLTLDVLLRQPNGSYVVSSSLQLPVPGSNYPNEILPVDLNGDGRLDLVLASTAPPVASLRAVMNAGNGIVVDATAQWFAGLPVTAPRSLHAADVDGDGRADLVFAGSGIHLFRNTGTQFVDESALRLQSLSGAGPLLGDLDGDGDADLLFDELFGSKRLLLNQAGFFVDRTATHLPPTPVPAMACLLDSDGDGDLDLFGVSGFAGQGATPAWQAELLRNDGSGRLLAVSPVDPFGPASSGMARIVAAELDGDGRTDVVVLGTSNAFARSRGNGTFEPARGLELLPGLPVDVDGDGLVDLVHSDGIRRQLAGGRFVFTAWPQPVPGTVLNPGLLALPQVADIDGDGDLDFCTQTVWRNDGVGNFTADPTTGYQRAAARSGVFDLDGDGNLDIVSAGGVLSGASVQLHIGTGPGAFAPPVTLLSGSSATSIEFGDANGDGRIDIVLSGFPLFAAPTLLENQGNLAFAPLALPALNGRFRLVDLGAGHVDLLHDQSGPPRLFRRAGNTYTEITATALPAGFTGSSVAIGDVDLDGDLDLVGEQLLRNLGNGTFQVEAVGLSGARHVVDLDGDRDPDLLQGSLLAWNRERHLVLPAPARIGRNLRLELSARPGRAQGELAAIGLSLLQQAPAPTPLGLLHLARIDAFVLAVPANGSGLAELDLPVPNLPAIVGVTVHLQALHAGPAGLGFGNYARTTIE